jgi:hypothetical protein
VQNGFAEKEKNPLMYAYLSNNIEKSGESERKIQKENGIA